MGDNPTAPFTTAPAQLFHDVRSDLPLCTKCNKPVEHVSVEYGLRRDASRGLPDTIDHSGEVVLLIECHGEKFKISNWRGRVPDDYKPAEIRF
jgi:hypothetical protein